MRHFDIIYIHKWNYGGGCCCCCLHWRDVKNSWQTKKKVDRCATYMNLNMGLWTSEGPVSIINNQKKAFLWCLCTLLPLSLCVCVCVQMVRVFITTCMFVCVRQVLDMQMMNENIWQIQYIFALGCETRWLCVRVCLSSHPTCRRAAYWVENQDWDERLKKKEYEMQKGPFCTSVLSAFSTVLHLRPEWSQWELSLVIQPPGVQPYPGFLATTGTDIICMVTKEVGSVTIAPFIFNITTRGWHIRANGRYQAFSMCLAVYFSRK